jgi:hypothetical protein
MIITGILAVGFGACIFGYFLGFSNARIEFKPMSSAPQHGHILALDEWAESGTTCQGYKVLYWLDAFDGMPSGWYGKNCGDLRHPKAWIISLEEFGGV